MILIKEEFVGGEKWRRAVELGGGDAIVLWLAMKRYCSQYADTEGFVPNEELDGLPGAPRGARRKALQALLGCGRLLPGGERGPGLVDSVEGGWQLHDYADHCAPLEEIELRREKQRLKKQAYREGKRRELAAVRRLAAELDAPPFETHPLGRDTGGQPGDSPGDTEGDSPGDSRGTVPRTPRGTVLAGARPPEHAQARACARVGAHPNPTQPNQKNLRRLASAIREPRGQPGELGHHPVEACAAHRQFADEHGIELEPLLAELRAAPSTAALSGDEIRTRLAAMLARAVEQPLGGAA